MAFLHFKNVRIAGIAAGVPKIVKNNLTSESQISESYNNKDYVETTGVVERRFDRSLTTSDLCFKAAQQLLNDLGWSPKDVDAIIMVSQTLDFILPATSCIIQDKLGASKECYTEDVQLGCSGWVYGISNVASLLQNGTIRKALLMAGDAKGHFIKDEMIEDPLFGHAGTVTAFEYAEGADGFMCHYGTDGSGYDAIITLEGGSRNPFNVNSLEYEMVEGRKVGKLSSRMKGMDVFSFGISTAPKSIKKLAEKFEYDYLSSDYYIFHQANMKMNEMIVKKLKLPKEKVPMCIRNFGNTSSASIPLTMVTELKAQLSNGKHRLTCCGFGVGLSWGTVTFETDNIVVSDLVEVESNDNML